MANFNKNYRNKRTRHSKGNDYIEDRPSTGKPRSKSNTKNRKQNDKTRDGFTPTTESLNQVQEEIEVVTVEGEHPLNTSDLESNSCESESLVNLDVVSKINKVIDIITTATNIPEGESLNDNLVNDYGQDYVTLATSMIKSQISKFSKADVDKFINEEYLPKQYGTMKLTEFLTMSRVIETDQLTRVKLFIKHMIDAKIASVKAEEEDKLVQDNWNQLFKLKTNSWYGSDDKLVKLLKKINNFNSDLKISWQELLFTALNASKNYYNAKFLITMINHGLKTKNYVFIPKLGEMLDILTDDEYRSVMSICLIPAMESWATKARRDVIYNKQTFGRTSTSQALMWIDNHPTMRTPRALAQNIVQYYLK